MPNAGRRFAATLGELTGGRVGLCAASVALLRCSSTVAIRYSLQRQQFGPPGAPEIVILDYQSQQVRSACCVFAASVPAACASSRLHAILSGCLRPGSSRAQCAVTRLAGGTPTRKARCAAERMLQQCLAPESISARPRLIKTATLCCRSASCQCWPTRTASALQKTIS